MRGGSTSERKSLSKLFLYLKRSDALFRINNDNTEERTRAMRGGADGARGLFFEVHGREA